MIPPLPKAVVSHPIAKNNLIDLDDDIDTGSDYDQYELSLGKGGCNNPRHVHIEIKLMTKSSAWAWWKFSPIPWKCFWIRRFIWKNSRLYFLLLCIWYQEWTSNRYTNKDVVCGRPISAFMMLINQGSILTFDAPFVAFFCNFIHQKTGRVHENFLRLFLRRRFDQILMRLKNSRALLISLLMQRFRGEMETIGVL